MSNRIQLSWGAKRVGRNVQRSPRPRTIYLDMGLIRHCQGRGPELTLVCWKGIFSLSTWYLTSHEILFQRVTPWTYLRFSLTHHPTSEVFKYLQWPIVYNWVGALNASAGTCIEASARGRERYIWTWVSSVMARAAGRNWHLFAGKVSSLYPPDTLLFMKSFSIDIKDSQLPLSVSISIEMYDSFEATDKLWSAKCQAVPSN